MRAKQFNLRSSAKAATPGSSGTGAGNGGGRSSIQLNFKNHCLFCLRRQTPQQMYDVVKVNPKKIGNFQPIICYLTGTDPTAGKRDGECKRKNIPLMGNLPPMCDVCYKVLGELHRLHLELMRLQVLIQEQTLKGRRMIEQNVRTVTGILKTPTNRGKFYKNLKDEGMPKEQFDIVMEFVENFHNLIVTQGQNEVKYPAYPDDFDGKPRKIPISATTRTQLQRFQTQQRFPRIITPAPHQNQNPRSAAPPNQPSGILIPVQLIPTSNVTTQSQSSSSSSSPSINLSSVLSVAQPRVSTGPIRIENTRLSQPSTSTTSNTGMGSNWAGQEEIIDLCDDSDDEIKSEKGEEEEGRTWEEEEKEGDDDDHYPLNDPLCSPEHTHEEDEAGKVRTETLKDPEKVEDGDDHVKSEELAMGVHDGSESIQSQMTTTTTSLPAHEVQSASSVPTQERQPTAIQTILTVTTLMSMGESGSYQLLPVVTAATQVPVYGNDPKESTNVKDDKLKPKRARKKRIRKPREKKPKLKKIPKNPQLIQRCDICYEFLERNDMKAHVKIHIGNDGFTCAMCNRTFATKRSFFYHHNMKSLMGKKCDLERRKQMPEFFSPTCIICDENIPVKMESFRLRQYYVHLFSVHENDTSLEESHECKICESKFRTENGLDFHLNEHLHERRRELIGTATSVAELRIGVPETRNYYSSAGIWKERMRKKQCTECPHDAGIYFDTLSTLEDHIKMDHKPRQCKLCDYSCMRLATYIYHLKNSHIASEKPCDICGTEEGNYVKFPRLSDLWTHYFTVHGIGKEQTCDICNLKFHSNTSFINHNRMFHGVKVVNLKPQRMEDAAAADADPNPKNVKIIKVKKRKATTERRPRKTAKLNDEDDKNVFPCEHCLNGHHDNRFQNKHRMYSQAELESHVDRHHRRECPTCGSNFLSLAVLREHGIKDHPELHPPLDCPKCFRTIYGHDKMKLHLAVHSNPYRYPCPICFRKFKSYFTLYNHKFVHSKERPHICEQCGMGFTQKRFLASHLPTHLPGGRPKLYCCHVCGKRYGDKIYMLRHIKAHHPTGNEMTEAGVKK